MKNDISDMRIGLSCHRKGSNLIPSATLQLLLSTATYQFLISI